MDVINGINDKKVCLKTRFEESSKNQRETSALSVADSKKIPLRRKPAEVHKGRLLIDVTVCPRDIAYPNYLDLLSDVCEKSEQLIDSVYDRQLYDDV